MFVRLSFISVWCIGYPQSDDSKQPSPNRGATSQSKIALTEIHNEEFAHVLNSSSMVARVENKHYTCRVLSTTHAAQGADKKNLHFTYYYVANGTHGEAPVYKLFKVGPFYDVVNTTVIPGEVPEAYVLTIQHSYGEKKTITRYRIGFEKMVAIGG